jgi:cytochrome c oxidase cbb3-type subunit III
MSDFSSTAWSVFIWAVVIIGLIFCLVVLIASSRHKVVGGANDNTTGHVWDNNLKEMNNPLPRWWMGLFILTVIFAVIYLVLYPGLGSTAGKLGWTSKGQYQAEKQQAQQEISVLYSQFVNMSPQQLASNKQAMDIGQRLYLNNCAMCHGSDAKGSKSFPNLADHDWLYGGELDTIKQTILHGRQGNMPPMAAAVGSPADVRNVANYVLSLSDSPHNSVAAQLGKEKFAVCAACHGAEGKGNTALGAPNLTDKIWLHGWGEDAVIRMINNGKLNVMPPQGSRFTSEQVHVLAGYIWSLSNNKPIAKTVETSR